MHRREFVTYGSAAILAGAGLGRATLQEAVAQTSSGFAFDLHFEEIYEEMIDGEVFFALASRDPVTRSLRTSITVVEGQKVSIRVTNKTRKPRRLAITGLADDYFVPIASGRSEHLVFTAPQAGTYVYHDNSEGPACCAAGLHGALIVLPADGRTAAGSHTPYTRPTPAQARLFDALGTSRFPGEKWRGDLLHRNKVWVFNAVDPELQKCLEQDKPIDHGTLRRTFRPRYFTINGLSGYNSAHDPSTTPSGYIGEPTLIRTLNAGMATHAPHIHGNHVFRLSATGRTGGIVKNTSVLEVDTWMMRPMWRVDVLLPFIKPDDIPAKAWPPKEEPFPLRYPMHCHMELSQVAGGGNYPQGLITDWEILGLKRGEAA